MWSESPGVSGRLPEMQQLRVLTLWIIPTLYDKKNELVSARFFLVVFQSFIETIAKVIALESQCLGFPG